MQKSNKKKKLRKSQSQDRPGQESQMKPQPVFDYPDVKGSGKLKNKVAVITGADSGIGRAVAILFAKEGANIAALYLNEHKDAKLTRRIVEDTYKRRCILLDGDIADEKFCKHAIKKVKKEFGRIDILVNNAAMHYEDKDIKDVTAAEL